MSVLKPINPNEDDLSHFAHWYLFGGEISRLHVPFQHALVHNGELTGITIYRHHPYQVQLWILKPNFVLPEHIHPNVDNYQVFLYGMKFTHSGKQIVNEEMINENEDGVSKYLFESIRVKPNDLHGGQAGPNGAAFLSIQKWLNDREPSSVSFDWNGNHCNKEHLEDIKKYEKNT